MGGGGSGHKKVIEGIQGGNLLLTNTTQCTI